MSLKRQKALEGRERILELTALYWQSYLRDTQKLEGVAYQKQERASWVRLKGNLAMLKRRERRLDLEDEHR